MRFAVKAGCLACVLCSVMAAPGFAQERVTLGWGRMFSNDALGDGKDRWHTGSYVLSRVRGVNWEGALPTTPGEILEFRAWAGILAPQDLTNPDPDDRPYAATLSFGLHTHYGWAGNEVSLGADLAFVGPQNGISNFQKWVHNIVGMPAPTVPEDQLGNGVYPTLSAEIGRNLRFGDNVTLRPFAAAQAGIETWARVGADLVIGRFGQDDLMLRDPGNGQRYRAVEGVRDIGASFVLGADFAEVFDSAYLPSDSVATLKQEQSRLRAGMQWQGDSAAVFYGVTYLSPEFEQQDEGQVTGQLNVDFKF